MNPQQQQLQTLLQAKRLVKVIAGIDNVDRERVQKVVDAATIADAGAVDVAARADIVSMVRQATKLPVFASSVNPKELLLAIQHGADVAELGNFDALYKQGFYLTAEEVLQLVRQTRTLLSDKAMLSVTIPGHLSLEAQVRLAQKLHAEGVTLFQTEGASRVVTTTRTVELLSPEDKVRLTFENTQALCRAVPCAVMTASGLHAGNVNQAFLMGASAVGIGSAVNQLESQTEMVTVLREIMNQVAQRKVFSPEVSLAS